MKKTTYTKVQDIFRSNALFFIVSFVVCTLLYLPALSGYPIWDDISFWFLEEVIGTKVSLENIIKYSSWPVSMAYQKLSLDLWGFNFKNYHVLNLFVHFVNALLLYEAAVILRVPFKRWIFLFFLFHPANVISVGWMIQMKTLLCFLFAILSFITFDRAIKNKWWLPLSVFLFLLSLLSKSASIAFPFLILFYGFKKVRLKYLIIFVLPFFLASAWSAKKLLDSKVTQESLSLFIQKSGVSRAAKKVESYIPMPSIIKNKGWQPNVIIMQRSSRYYFEQTILPLKNHPVKGNGRAHYSFGDMLYLIYSTLLVAVSFKSRAVWYLIGGHLLLLPFLGLIPAPYMNITWVSDQHLYLVIPLFIMFWFTHLDRIPWKKVCYLPLIIILPFFIYKTHQAARMYVNEVAFFDASLKENPDNIPIQYNLAISYLRMNNPEKAKEIVDEVIYQSRRKEKRHLQWDPYFGKILYLEEKIKDMLP